MQARELTQRKSTTIGVIVPSLTNLFFPSVVYGIESELKKYSLSIILMTTSNDKDEEKKCINNLLARNVAGIIVVDPTTSNIKNKFYNELSKKIPFVFINGYTTVPNISSVSNDESMGCKLALRYLLDNNHRNILFIRGKDSYSYDVKDLSIIGYDNIQLSSLIEPKLTTMDQNMYLLGTNAASLIKDKIDCNNEYSKRIILNNTLVERDTVKKI